MVKLELTMTLDPEESETLLEVARELRAVLPPEKHQALVALSRAVCREELLRADGELDRATILLG